jgi:hypothetical protein
MYKKPIKICVCFLDAKQAFGMKDYKKLYPSGIEQFVSMYTNMESRVRFRGVFI